MVEAAVVVKEVAKEVVKEAVKAKSKEFINAMDKFEKLMGDNKPEKTSKKVSDVKTDVTKAMDKFEKLMGDDNVKENDLQAKNTPFDNKSKDANEPQKIRDLTNEEKLKEGDLSAGLAPNSTYKIGGCEYKTDDKGKVRLDLPLAPNKNYVLKGLQLKTDKEGKLHISPTVTIPFSNASNLDKKEYERQLAGQEKGMNKLSVAEYEKNRKEYKEQGRKMNDAQEKERQKQKADLIDKYQDEGFTYSQAKEKAEQDMSGKAALHDPDQIAGGNPENVTGMGDAKINSSIGSQWKSKIKTVDDEIQKCTKELTDDQKKNIYVNVKLVMED